MPCSLFAVILVYISLPMPLVIGIYCLVWYYYRIVLSWMVMNWLWWNVSVATSIVRLKRVPFIHSCG